MCICVFQDMYSLCFLKVKIRLIPESRRAKYSWKQEFWEECDWMKVV